MSGSSPVDEIHSTGESAKQSGQITCVACDASNPTGGQFCAGCGHALYEPCGSCNKRVLLSQAFCGTCGNDLVAALSKRKEDLESKIVNAISAAKERNFDRSNALLTAVLREKDFRFKEVLTHAKVAQDKIDSIAAQESASASDRIAAARAAYEIGDSVRVIELLGQVSPNLLTPDAKSQLQRSETRLEQQQQAERSLHEAFQKRDWATSGAILDQLLELQPDDESVAKLATKVGKKLLSKAAALREDHKYAAAANMLDCVPANSRGQEYADLQEIVERSQWLSSQFKDEPFATPTLGRLAKVWVEQSGGDPKSTAMLNRISQQIKSAKHSSRDLFASLRDSGQSWLGGRVGFLAFPSCVEYGDAKEQDVTDFRSSPGQFNIAIGLALQGLGLGRIREDFSPKKKLLKRLGRKKSGSCWGLDVGAFGIKAVCLEAGEDGQIRLGNCYRLPYETPLSRNTPESQADETIREAISEFLTRYEVEGTPVWASFPARELVSRFVKLPPVADKKAKTLFAKEIESRIPLPMDEVTCVSWIAGVPQDELTAIGRPAFVSAAKRQYVERYLENLSRAGLAVSGLQATPIALANFASIEFENTLALDVEDKDRVELKLPTVALVDCGAEMTTVLLMSEKSCWFWAFESGGNEFTRLVSRSTKTTHAEAEKLKRNPATLPTPESQFELVEQRTEEMRGRLFKIISDLLGEHDELDIQETWCVGGGALTHGWIKRILCEK